ncbi:hypothetical protein ACN38_g1650 [Penicillium nordicum]|uniref:Uncharacterized protein n=1 Tax=Penicillium nordicum TaxID=229535 RepID=A0A0M9WJK8_9EURO|nr:hypothetical protein ACN38_g1650 [Penicillium nordicum]
MNDLLNSLCTYPDWGYVIYRTTYSAESDTLFPDAIRYIEACIKQTFFQENQDPTNKPNEIWAKHQSTIVQDPAQFNGASRGNSRSFSDQMANVSLEINLSSLSLSLAPNIFLTISTSPYLTFFSSIRYRTPKSTNMPINWQWQRHRQLQLRRGVYRERSERSVREK